MKSFYTIVHTEGEAQPWSVESATGAHSKHATRSAAREAMRKLKRRPFVPAFTPADVTIELLCEYEDSIAPEDSFCDPRDVKIARDGMERGNDWAWCRVTVRASWEGFSGTNSLGGCCYESEADFRTPHGYFPDMCAEALSDLQLVIGEAIKRGKLAATYPGVKAS